MHETVSESIYEHEVMQVVGLQVSKRNSGRLVAVNREYRRRERIDLTETLNRFFRPRLSNGDRLGDNRETHSGRPGLCDRTTFSAAPLGSRSAGMPSLAA